MGLSDLGKQQSHIVIPPRAIRPLGALKSNVLFSLDLSLLDVTEITNWISGSEKLTSIIFPR